MKRLIRLLMVVLGFLLFAISGSVLKEALGFEVALEVLESAVAAIGGGLLLFLAATER